MRVTHDLQYHPLRVPIFGLTSALLFSSCLLLLSGRTGAALINYGSFVGSQVTYVDVTEDSGKPLALFGPPTVSGNSIDFNPVGFDATSSGGGSQNTVGNLAFMVVAHPGTALETITLTEAGDTTLSGNVPPGSMDTAAAVFVSGVLDIHEVDFAGINQISVPFSMTFSPSGGTFFLGTDGGGGPIFHTQFSGSVTIPIEQILIANTVPFSGGATKISVDLNNSLTAVSESGTSATIAKKDFGGITIVIPEPAFALSLTCLGLSALWRPGCGRRCASRGT